MIAVSDFLPYLNIVLVLCLTVGGFFAFRNGRQAQLTKFQESTNTALKQRIEALEGKILDFEKENIIQRHIIETITLALKQRGLIVTIDGDMVTIADLDTSITSSRKRASTYPASKTIRQE